jgi:hypothetical protein
MSSLFTSPKTRRFSSASLALASILLATSGLSAVAQSGKSALHAPQAREFRAYTSTENSRRCVPANGAQIMGNFAGADDRIDSVTGEICPR